MGPQIKFGFRPVWDYIFGFRPKIWARLQLWNRSNSVCPKLLTFTKKIDVLIESSRPIRSNWSIELHYRQGWRLRSIFWCLDFGVFVDPGSRTIEVSELKSWFQHLQQSELFIVVSFIQTAPKIFTTNQKLLIIPTIHCYKFIKLFENIFGESKLRGALLKL